MFLKNVQKEMDTLPNLMEEHVVDATSLACVSRKILMIVKRLVMKIQIVFPLRLMQTTMDAIYLQRVLMILPFKKKGFWKNMETVFMLKKVIKFYLIRQFIFARGFCHTILVYQNIYFSYVLSLG